MCAHGILSHMKTSILVTGASGYLGKLLVQRLEDDGYKVFSLGSSRDKTRKPRFKAFDLCDRKKCQQTLKAWKPDIIVHTAGFIQITTGQRGPSDQKLFRANVEATHCLLEAAENTGSTKLFIHLSSMCVYGNPQKPKVKETHPLQPMSFYGTSKKLSEELVEAAAQFGKMKCVCLRPMGFFGYPRRSGLIFTWIEKALQQKTIEVPRGVSGPWNVNSIQDVIEAIVRLAAKKSHPKYAVLNLGNDKPIKLHSLATTIVSLTQSKSKIKKVSRGTDIPFAYDLSALKQSLRWQPEPLTKRLEEYVEILKDKL